MSSTKTLSSLKSISYRSTKAKTAASSNYILHQALSLLPRKCNQCFSTLPLDTAYKWCEKCRQKDREKSRRKKERAKLRLQSAQHTPALPGAEVATPSSSHAPTPPLQCDVDPNVFLSLPRKRKADPDEAAATTPERPPKSAPRLKRTEFQTRGALFDALRAQLPRLTVQTPPVAYLNFYAGYTIVLDPIVDPEARVELLVSELKEQTVLPLGEVAKYVNGWLAGGYAQHHWCICRGVRSVPEPQPNKTLDLGTKAHLGGLPLKRSQSTLATWLAAGSKAKTKTKAASGTDAPREEKSGRGVCGGTITIDAVSDFSHPLAREGEQRMKGQRITIQVQHPGRELYV
ncbi:hypothetical protein C8Q79DRAFT_1013737 [Trametes meyenii]|nr:hypothetical protein C8Q79DRAFT_1013737 [Trametes meyenii]